MCTRKGEPHFDENSFILVATCNASVSYPRKLFGDSNIVQKLKIVPCLQKE